MTAFMTKLSGLCVLLLLSAAPCRAQDVWLIQPAPQPVIVYYPIAPQPVWRVVAVPGPVMRRCEFSGGFLHCRDVRSVQHVLVPVRVIYWQGW